MECKFYSACDKETSSCAAPNFPLEAELIGARRSPSAKISKGLTAKGWDGAHHGAMVRSSILESANDRKASKALQNQRPGQWSPLCRGLESRNHRPVGIQTSQSMPAKLCVSGTRALHNPCGTASAK